MTWNTHFSRTPILEISEITLASLILKVRRCTVCTMMRNKYLGNALFFRFFFLLGKIKTQFQIATRIFQSTEQGSFHRLINEKKRKRKLIDSRFSCFVSFFFKFSNEFISVFIMPKKEKMKKKRFSNRNIRNSHELR